MEEVKAAVDPEPSLEKFGFGGSRREFRVRGGHVLRVTGRPIGEVASALMLLVCASVWSMLGHRFQMNRKWTVIC